MLSGKVWYEELDLLTNGSRTLGSMVAATQLLPAVVCSACCAVGTAVLRAGCWRRARGPERKKQLKAKGERPCSVA